MSFAQEEWLRYSRDFRGQSLMGILPEGYQTYRFASPSGHAIARSMLSIHELALLYALARHDYRGEGEIVDLGPLLGASTFALARGLHDNAGIGPRARGARIHSFDLWSARGYEAFLGPGFRAPPSGSLVHEFNRINRDHLDAVVPSQGDLMGWTWGGAPVEILFVDVAKTWDLNDHVLSQFFPSLIPGRSIVVQQDYIHFNEYWIHLVMERWRERFELIGMLYGATAYYRVLQGFTKAELSTSLRALSWPERRDLLEAARARAPAPVREVMKSAAAKCAIECGAFEDARALLDAVSVEKLSDDPVLQVHGIAKDNLAKVRALLAARAGG